MDEDFEENTRVEYHINRNTYTQRDFGYEFEENPKAKLTFSKVKNSLKKIRLKTFGFALFPIFSSLSSYYTLRLFIMDIIAGVTMAFFHLPQGMAYGALAGLRAVNGLYTSFFPVIAYFFFSTSRHNSLGTFSLASLLFSDPINRITNEHYEPTYPTNSSGMSDEEYQFRLNISMTLALSVGLLQIIMALLQVGFLATYLSGPLISGFMCASAFHVLASQFNYLFGISLPKVYGPGNFFIKCYDLCAHIKETNIATVIICIVCIVILHIVRLYINPFFRKKFKFPLPIELLIVITSTVISHFAKFHQRWGVSVVGRIPRGLPPPALPTFAYFSELLPDIFVISIITFAINAGLVKTYATEFGYDVLDNQELLAMGISNTFGAFFKCHTACGALGRTAVVVTVGMASQIASLISCFLFVLILYFIAPYLESLPRAVLGCIVCVALHSTFKKVLDLKRLWKVSKIDASIWLVSFVTTLGVDITYGVAIGFIYSILTVVSRSQYGGRFLLGEANDTDLYAELKRFEELHELDNIKIIRYDGPVYFANIDSFRKSVYRLSGVDPVKIKRQQNKRVHKCKVFPNLFKSHGTKDPDISMVENDVKRSDDEENVIEDQNSNSVETDLDENTTKSPEVSLRYIILDASGWMFTDTVGLRGIKEMIKNYSELEITVFVTSLRPRLREMFAASGVYGVLSEGNFFMSIHDAVLVAKTEMCLTSHNENQQHQVTECDPEEDERNKLGKIPHREIGGVVLRRRRMTEEMKSVIESDPDITTDLSVLGEERAILF